MPQSGVQRKARPGELGTAAGYQASGQRPAMTKHRLIVVEDEEGIRTSIRRFFTNNGYEVMGADSVARARKVLDVSRPDAAIVDYRLPDGDGLELLETLKAIDPSIPVVILTAHGSIDLAVRAIKEGAEQFLTKPVELPALLVLVERTLEHRRNRQLKLCGKVPPVPSAPRPIPGGEPGDPQARNAGATGGSLPKHHPPSGGNGDGQGAARGLAAPERASGRGGLRRLELCRPLA